MLKTSITLQDLARLDQQLSRDREIPLHQLRQRDRSIGVSLQAAPPERKLLAWLNRTAPQRDAHPLSGIEFSLGFWLALAGLIAGLMTMSGMLLVDRQQPVNVLLFLALFVGVQWLLLLLTLLVSLALAMHSQLHLPFEGLNPARWLLRRSFQARSGDVRWGAVVRLALLSWGQLFGVFFNMGLLAAMLVVLSVVDRSFGWSSTLDISLEGLHRVLSWLAAPWANWLPAATVDVELIAATRYQSLQTEFATAQVSAMRAWWPFLFACVAFYGLLPRAILSLVFYCLYRNQLIRTFLHYPGASMVLDRMISPLVHTQGHTRESASDTPADAGPAALQALPPQQKQQVIDWSGALGQAAAEFVKQLSVAVENIPSAGLNLTDDRELLARINARENEHPAVIILVKSWEPPLSELGDFLRGVNASLDCYLLLLPLPNRPIKAEELADWQQFARQKHHPRLTLVSGGSQQTAESVQ